MGVEEASWDGEERPRTAGQVGGLHSVKKEDGDLDKWARETPSRCSVASAPAEANGGPNPNGR